MDDAISQLVSGGMDKLEAQTALLGEDYNELLALLGGTTTEIDSMSQAFNDARAAISEFDELIDGIPDQFDELKEKLMLFSTNLKYILDLQQSFAMLADELTHVDEIWGSLTTAIKAQDWEQASKDIYKLEKVVLDLGDAYLRLAEAYNYLGLNILGDISNKIAAMAGALGGWLMVAKVFLDFFGLWDDQLNKFRLTFLYFQKEVLTFFTELGQKLGGWFAKNWDFSDKIKDIEIEIEDLNSVVGETIDKFLLWEEQLERMDASDIVSNITAGLREWQDIIERFELGDIRKDMNALLFDMWKMMTQIDKLWGPEGFLPDPTQYTKAMTALHDAMKIQINEYFDALLEGFQDFRDTLKRDMQGLTKEGRTAANVTEDIFKVFKDMGGLRGFTEGMDTDEYLANAEKMRSLILERYEIEKQAIEGMIAKMEELRDAWQSVADSIKAQLLSITTGGLNPDAGVYRIEGMEDNVARLRALYEGASGTEKAGYASELASALEDYLTMAEDTYSRPSTAYKQIYEAVVAELQALQKMAETKVSYADAQLIGLNKQLVDLQTKTYQELQWLDGQIATAMRTINYMRDYYLSLISGNMDAVKTAIENTRTNTAIVAGQLVVANGYLHKLANTGVRALFSGMPGYKEGIDYVPRTGPAIVHQGERITPAGESGNITVTFGDIIIPAGSNVDANQFEEQIIDMVRWGRVGMAIKEKVKNAA